MASWFERGHPELIEAFNDVCEKIDHGIRAELQQRKPLLKDASTCTTEDDPREDQLVIIDRLEKENARLRSELAAQAGHKHGQSDASISDHPVDLETADDAKLENPELAMLKLRFNVLNGNFKTAREALERRKCDRDDWRRRAKSYRKIIKAVEEEHGIQLLDGRDKDLQTNEPSASLIPDDGSSGMPTLPPLCRTRADEESSRDNGHLQSTQGDPEEEREEEPEDDLPPLPAAGWGPAFSIQREPSSDAPIFVSERVLKKRKLETNVPEAAKARRIKVEADDSSPILRGERYGLHSQESLDLDDIAQKMPTPRKRKDTSDSADEEHSPVDSPSLFERLSNLQPASHDDPAQALAASTILTPISGNRQSKRLTDDSEDTPSSKYGLGRGIESLAEDGGHYEKGAFEKKQRNSHAPHPGIEGRLGNLLNTTATENRSLISSPARPLPDSLQLGLEIPERRELPFDQQIASRQSVRGHAAEAKPTTPRSGVDDQRTPTRIASPQKRKSAASALRQKSLADLRLDDFKVNPSANKGTDYAFSEVVRDKDDRASLRGCTDMHCCGKHFRALALSQRPDPPLTATQRQEEQKLLENYLGDYSSKLATMTKEEKAEFWVEAKTEELANKYGKHRHRFARMQSPPGFWNADFPTTQELDDEKEEASKRERQTVAERYREALRPSGRWMFRDE